MSKFKYLFKVIFCYVLYYSLIWFFYIKIIKPKGLIIFVYHNFSSYNNNPLNKGSIYETNYVDQFKKHLKFLNKFFNVKKNPIISISDFQQLKFLITFDDGYKDNYTYAFPLLKKFNNAAIFFVTTNYISSTKLSWYDKLRYIDEKGLINSNKINEILRKVNKGIINVNEINLINLSIKIPQKRIMLSDFEIKDISNDERFLICSHSDDHIPLNSKNYNEQQMSIESSIQKLKDLKVYDSYLYFSYPNGSFDYNTEKILKNMGTSYAFTTKAGINKNPQSFNLKRIGIQTSDSIPILMAKIFINLIVSNE